VQPGEGCVSAGARIEVGAAPGTDPTMETSSSLAKKSERSQSDSQLKREDELLMGPSEK
jgi:hypothetical protein